MKLTHKLINQFYLESCGNIDYTNLDLYEVKCMINIANKFVSSVSSEDNIDNLIELLTTCLDACGSDYNDLYDIDEFFILLEELDDLGSDNWLELPSIGEVRIIHEDDIDQIWTDSLIEQIQECYDLDNLPSFIVIDWEATAENCKIDGMGHHFASYDHEEHDCGDWYIFRTN